MQSHRQRFWSITGGNNSEGVSLLTALLGTALSRAGKSVIVVDADPKGSSFQVYLGISDSTPLLHDFLSDRVPAESVVLPTNELGMRVLRGAGALVGIANPRSENKQKLIQFIGGLNAEYILVDLGSGTLPDKLDFFNVSDEGIVVVNPDPTSMHNAYEFVRSAVYRKIQKEFGASPAAIAALREFADSPDTSKPRTMIDFFDHLCASDPDSAEKVAALVDSYRPHVVVNQAGSDQDLRVAEIVQSACKKFLNVDLRIGGVIPADSSLCATRDGLPGAGIDPSGASAWQQVRILMLRLLNSGETLRPSELSSLEREAMAAPIMGLNHNLMIRGNELHIQTEDMGQNVRCIATQVFMDGKIILSTKLQYPPSLADPSNRSQVMELMRKQHFETIRDIENGRVQTPPLSRHS